MGEVLAEEKLKSPLVISSPAVRAHQTIDLLLESSGLSIEPRFDDRIYEADVRTLLEVVQSIPASSDTAIMVGHNPGFENLLNYFTGESRHMPTCALAKIQFDAASWSEVTEQSGRLELFVTPKDLDD